MKKALQIALLGLLGICAVPAALHAQDRDSRYQRDRYEQQRYDRDRHDRDDYRYRSYGNGERSGYASGYAQYNAYPAPYYNDRCDRPSATGRSIAIVGGSAAAGALIGGAAGHGQGAAIGAFVGGITGLIVDQATRDRRHY